MLRFVRSSDRRVAVGLQTGSFDTRQALREVERAYLSGDLAPGLDSIVVYDPGIEVSHVSVADLFAIRDCIARHEAAAGDGSSYRSVFVTAEREAQIIANVYAATWSGNDAVMPQHNVAQSLVEAEWWLGCAPVKSEIATLRPALGMRHLC